MNTATISAIVLASLLAAASAGCASTATPEEAALNRAYEGRVAVTGSRIRHRVDGRRDPEVAYKLESLSGPEAQELVREMRDMRNNTMRRR